MKRRKLPQLKFIIPIGLFSLILFPLFYISCALDFWLQGREKAMQIVMCDEHFNSNERAFHFSCTPPKRNYHFLNLTGSSLADKLNLRFAQLLIRQLVETNDTGIGVSIHYGNQSKYNEFVRSLDICRIEKAKSYMISNDALWVFTFDLKYYKKDIPKSRLMPK